MNIITKLKDWHRRRSFFIIADPTDNSVTFSKALFRHLRVMDQQAAKVCVFRVGDDYAFAVNPDLGDAETQLADIQYNSKYKTIGFESLVPTVNRILYDYGLAHIRRVKLSVRVRRSGKLVYYVFCRPVDRDSATVKEKD